MFHKNIERKSSSENEPNRFFYAPALTPIKWSRKKGVLEQQIGTAAYDHMFEEMRDTPSYVAGRYQSKFHCD